MNYIIEEHRLNDDEMILKFKKNIEEYKKQEKREIQILIYKRI